MSNRYQPPAQHKAWAARAALCIARNDHASMHLLLDQVTAEPDGVNDLVFALASECASLFESASTIDALAAYAEAMQARALDAENG